MGDWDSISGIKVNFEPLNIDPSRVMLKSALETISIYPTLSKQLAMCVGGLGVPYCSWLCNYPVS